MSGIFKSYSFGKWIYQRASISTNADLPISVSKNSLNANIVLYTYKQWAGKGQIGRKWHSGEDKNLTFSFLIGINQLLASKQFRFNMIISLALRDWIASVVEDSLVKNDDCRIKWPNDIYIKDKKIAGILIQNTLMDKYISKSMVGIGVNVNELKFPDDLPNPVSFTQITDKEYDLNLLFANMLLYLENRFYDYDQISFQTLKKLYVEKMYLLNQRRTFTLSENEQNFEAEITGISDEGKLELRQKERMSYFNFREIRYTI